jgi:hypothetical protein
MHDSWLIDWGWSAYLWGIPLSVILLNFVCWVVLKCWPLLLRSENERLSLDYSSRFEGDLKRYIPEWFDIKAEDWPEFVEERNASISRGGHVYDPFVEVRHPASAARFYNFHSARFRFVKDQGPWPISQDTFNIFFFGGSTTMNVGPDWTSIPSRLQEELNSRGAAGKAVRVYNFGCGSYFSTQERIRFQQLLLDGAVPDMAIFLDGVNDFYFFDGRPSIAGFFDHAIEAHNRDNEEERWSKLAARPKWRLLGGFLSSLPLFRATDAIGRYLARRNAHPEEVLYRPIPIDADALMSVIERYLGNKRQIEALANAYGIQTVFVWQPTPAYKYDLQYHVALSRHYGLGGHERSGAGYVCMKKVVESDPPGNSFIWLADIQEDELQPLYLDNMHYTCEFSRTIARHIADALISRQLIPRDTPTAAGHSSMTGPSDAAAQDGVNRITASALENYHLAEVTAEYANEGGPLAGERVIRLVASKAKSEHYAVLSWTAPTSSGATTFSV